MLPVSIRNRKPAASRSSSMNSMQVMMNDTALRLKKLPTKAKWLLGISAVLGLFMYTKLFIYFTRNHLSDESFLETTKCPACYGMSLCNSFFNEHASFDGWSKVRLLDTVNIKNVHYGTFLDRKVVLKKLAHNDELKAIDEKICIGAGRLAGCDLAHLTFSSKLFKMVKETDLTPEHLKGLGDLFRCPSNRLVDRVWEMYKEKKPNTNTYHDRMMFLTTAMVSSEPLLLQAFPASSGWPFPAYLGACGRFIMEDYAGKTLANFHNAPWAKRVDLAYQIFQIADKLTNDPDMFALYLTDYSYDNFAVDEKGIVKLIDVENVIVVDKMALESEKPEGWDVFLESTFDECKPGSNCLSFVADDLCTHVTVDHNYYAACRNLLSTYASEPGYEGGLLHDMPMYARNDYNLNYLLNECARPTKVEGRFKVKEKLLHSLNDIHRLEQGLEPDKYVS